MRLKDKKTSNFLEAKVSRLQPEEIDGLAQSEDFSFDWRLEINRQNEVYKIYLFNQNGNILGLISLKDIPKEFRIHINLIEVKARHIGKDKGYDRIAGCLLAYACQLAFQKSYDGFISLIPKTSLVAHYCQKYGFQKFGNQLGLNREAATDLIRKYL